MYQCSPKFVTKRKESILGVDLSVHPITMSTVLAYSKKDSPRVAPLETLLTLRFFNGEITTRKTSQPKKHTSRAVDCPIFQGCLTRPVGFLCSFLRLFLQSASLSFCRFEALFSPRTAWRWDKSGRR